jgi:hypothetical protein
LLEAPPVVFRAQSLTKDYVTGAFAVHALRGISFEILLRRFGYERAKDVD